MSIDDADRKRIVQSIRGYLARERISRDEFARRTKLGKSTVDKLVVGIFSERTILQIEAQTKVSLLDGATRVEAASAELGGYTRDETKNYLGDYVFARPSFHDDGSIHAFQMQVVWDSVSSGLLVKEVGAGKKVPLQFGRIYIPRASSHLFILSNEQAWLKQVIFSQMDIYRRMKGIMLTMGHAFANIYTPVAMPTIMNKYDGIEPDMVGKVDSGSRMYEEYNQDLCAVEEGQYAKWVHPRRSETGR